MEHSAKLNQGDMMALPYADNYFDVAVDIFSMYRLNWNQAYVCQKKVSRVLKKDAKFFFYTPSVNSDVFKKSANLHRDEYTLCGLADNHFTAFLGNNYNFRFWPLTKTEEILKKYNLPLVSQEKISRIYNNTSEYFEFVSVEAIKI